VDGDEAYTTPVALSARFAPVAAGAVAAHDQIGAALAGEPFRLVAVGQVVEGRSALPCPVVHVLNGYRHGASFVLWHEVMAEGVRFEGAGLFLVVGMVAGGAVWLVDGAGGAVWLLLVVLVVLVDLRRGCGGGPGQAMGMA
jgi:hypothetical protein